MNSNEEFVDLGEGWAELVRVLENMDAHHGDRPRFYSKREMMELLSALYEVAVGQTKAYG